MNEFKHLTNLCEFIANREQFVEAAKEIDATEIKQLFAEQIFNLIVEVDVDESIANDIADKLADAYFKDEQNEATQQTGNLTYRLGKLLTDAATEHIAPNMVEELAYEMPYDADVDVLLAAKLSYMMQKLARFVEPPVFIE